MSASPVDRLGDLPFFSESDYLALNPDVAQAGLVAADHAFRYAPAENRPMFRRERLARAWGEAVLETARPRSSTLPRAGRERRAAIDGDLPGISVFVSSGSDPADIALASSLVDALAAAGARVAFKDETADPTGDHGIPIVVAPQVFFEAGSGPLWERGAFIGRSLAFNTVAIHTPAFKRALPYILRSRGLLEASPQVARMFGGGVMPALHVRLGSLPRGRWLEPSDLDHPLVRALPPAGRDPEFQPERWDARPIDLSFFGRESARRSTFFRRHAAAFAARPCFIYVAQPMRDSLAETVEARHHFRVAGHVGGQARLSLHVAEDEFPQFDWHRCIAQAMASGAVVVSDSCFPHPDYEVGVHLFQDDVRHLAELARWLLDDPDGRRAAVDAQGRALAAAQDAFTGFAGDLRAFLSSIAR